MPELIGKHSLPIPVDEELADGESAFRALATRLDAVIPVSSTGLVWGKVSAVKVAAGIYRITHGMGRKPIHVIANYGVGGTGDALSVRWVGFGDYGPTATTFCVIVRYSLSDALYTGSTVNIGWLGW